LTQPARLPTLTADLKTCVKQWRFKAGAEGAESLVLL